MANLKIQLSTRQLKLGMFVAELDRPWLGTPFLFQGFHIRCIEEIDKLQSICDTVLVDTNKSSSASLAHARQSLDPDRSQSRDSYALSASFEEEILTANEIRADTEACLENVFDDVRSGRMIDLAAVKRTVSDTVDGILRNPDAHVSLTQLKEWDNYTAQHSINVCILALAFARHLGLSRHDMELLGAGALLHDIGKLKTPLEVLNKPGKLTAAEFKIMQSHPVQGHGLLKDKYGLPQQVSDMAFSHHERIAGGGYPRGLTGTQITVWSKMVAIVDVYDAITSDRCYHKGMSPTEGLTKMYGWRMKDFDADLLEKFIQCIGIYPVGTLVELTSGEVGLVISVNPISRLKPKIDLILDQNKQPYFPTRVVNLDSFDPEAGYSIRDVLAPGAFGISIREHLTPIQAAQSKLILPVAR